MVMIGEVVMLPICEIGDCGFKPRSSPCADVVQLVERMLTKHKVVSPSLTIRSKR